MPVQSILMPVACSSAKIPSSPTTSKIRIQPSDIPAVASAFSGALGGAFATLLVYPVDLVTTRMQIQGKVQGGKKYKHVFDAFKQIYEEEGLGAFYNGATQSVLSVMISAFFYFYAYDILRNGRLRQVSRSSKSGRAPSTLGIAEELLIGSLAGMFCKFITSPLSNIVTRQQTAAVVAKSVPVDEKGKPVTKVKTSAIDIAKDIYVEKGITGLWTGYKATMILSVNPSLTYYFFQVLKALLIHRKYRDNPTSFQLFFYPATAKTLATLLTYPLLLLKTQMQMKSKSAKKLSFSSLFFGTNGSQKGRLATLYQGASGQVLKGFFSQGITMLTKDQISRLIIYVYFVLVKSTR